MSLPRSLKLPQQQEAMRQRTIYEPRFYHDSPFMYYQRVYTSKIDVMTTISVQVGWTAKADTIYGIREYPVQTSGGSSHQIEKLVRQFSSWKLDRRQIQHLLLPLHCFFDVDKQLFYTVSEHAAMTMTLGKMLLGLKQWPYLLLNDDTGAIIHQILSATEFLVSQGLQHDDLSPQNILITGEGKVKIGAIDKITASTPGGWGKMINTLVWLARALVNDHGSSLTHTLEELVNILEPCSECDDTCRRSDIDESCCDGVSMLTRVNSLSKSLDTSGYATRCSVGLSASIVEVISKIKRSGFANQAKSAHLRAILEFASGKAFWETVPASPAFDKDDNDVDKAGKLLYLGDSRSNSGRRRPRSTYKKRAYAVGRRSLRIRRART